MMDAVMGETRVGWRDCRRLCACAAAVVVVVPKSRFAVVLWVAFGVPSYGRFQFIVQTTVLRPRLPLFGKTTGLCFRQGVVTVVGGCAFGHTKIGAQRRGVFRLDGLTVAPMRGQGRGVVVGRR